MNVDLRNFVYPLAALQQQRTWQLHTAQSQLASAHRLVEQAQKNLEDLQQQHTTLAQETLLASQQRIDPPAHRRALAYLGHLATQIDEAQQRLQSLRSQQQTLREAVIDKQQQLDLTEQHRLDCQTSYANAEQTRQSNIIDQDWNARSLWSARHQR